MNIVNIIALIAGLVVGSLIGWIVHSMRAEKILRDETTRRDAAETDAARVPTLEANLATRLQEIAKLNEEKTQLEQTLRSKAEEVGELKGKLITLESAEKALTVQFQNLANQIFEEKNQKSKEHIDALLAPLKEQLNGFKAKIEEVYINEGKDRSALSEQVKQLMALNQTLSQDAQNLTLALKGDNKTQGDFGEIILEKLLQNAGLIEGQHYVSQQHIADNRPDVVIHLPANRHLVVDSKMTLPDYKIYASEENDKEARNAALKKFLTSIRAHIEGLSKKNYQSLYGLNSIDFVVMFIPLEPAFMLAVTRDQDLFSQAWEKNILLVSPSTLLFVIRTVAYLWTQENQSRNAQAIADRGAELYEKLVGFVGDLDAVGKNIQQAQNSFEDARKKLSEGKGNAIRQAEMLKELGVKPNKNLPAAWIEPTEP